MQFHNVGLTKEDFDASGWDEVVRDSAAKQCFSYASGFRAKLKEAEETGDTKGQEIFGVLLAVTEPRLQVGGDDPFVPLWLQRDGSRTVIPDDIPDLHMDVLTELVPTISDPELRARLADILWIRRRNHKMAALAVDAYLEAAKALELGHPVSWLEGRDRTHRALQLALPLGKTGPLLKKVVDYIEDLIVRFDGKEPFLLPARMMDVLLQHRQGDPGKYATLANNAARQVEARGDWPEIARDYWEIEARWHALNKDPDSERAAKIRAAETYVQLAEAYAQTSPPSYLSAVPQIEQAIEAYRRIGNASERIDELKRILNEYQPKAMAEMQVHSTELPGLNKMAEDVINAVKGQSLKEALLRLALVWHPQRLDDLRILARQLSVDSPISFLASSVIVDDQGRTVAREPSSSRLGADNDDTLGPQISRVVRTYQALITEAVIEPARYQITTEHHVTFDAMKDLVTNNPFVPPGHEEFFTRGLLAGFRGDFMVAAHLLIPQIEGSIRYLLTLNGAIPYGLDDNMIQDAYLLDRVLREPDTAKMLGEEIVFDLKTLLVDRFGSNLRNRQSHGLMRAEEFEGWPPIYLWWLVLHLCCVCLISLQIKDGDEQQSAEPIPADSTNSDVPTQQLGEI